MRPVVLSVIEGRNFLLGTFDTTNFQSWWKSEPFPGAVESIHSPIHVYGQYHVCIVKMQDGTYSIYRTSNMGKSWVQVYNTNDIIYTLTAIDYGWIIGSTSTGWISSSLDSGYTWTKISSFAPNCKTVINIGDDYLFAHDGTSIWRSEDYAKTWSKVLTKTSWTSKSLHEGWQSWTFSWSGDASPALAGINKTVFVGFGPYLVISDDNGVTWVTHPSGWNNSAFNMPNWGNISLSPQAGNHILQLILTEGNGLSTGASALMMRNLVGNNVNYLYSGPNTSSVYNITSGPGWYWKTVFSLPYKADSGKITAYDVLRPGSSIRDLMAAVTTYDSNNNAIVMYSIDGGNTWAQINASTVTVYEGDPSQEIISVPGQQVFDEEYHTTYTWSGAACHNDGRYIEEYNKTVRNISSDIDLLLSFRKTYQRNYDCVLKKAKTKSYTVDIAGKKNFLKAFTSRVYNKKSLTKSMVIGNYTKTSFVKAAPLDVINALRLSSEFNTDVLLLKDIPKLINMRMNLRGVATKSHSMEMKLVGNHVEEIMNLFEEYTPQLPDIRYPDIPYTPWDSRKRGVDLR